MWILGATPALMMAPLSAAPAVRTAHPVMQIQQAYPQQSYAPSPAYQGAVANTWQVETAAMDPAVLVQGGSLRTWSFSSHLVERVCVSLSTDGRPLESEIDLWNGPDNTPVKMRVYVENADHT